MKRYVYITTQFEGIHCYPDAPEEVSYLRNYHRHLFKVKVQIEVQHNERDVEFIMLKHEIDNFLKVKNEVYAIPTTSSCESIAEMILEYVKIKYPERKAICEVSEDGENGAVLIEDGGDLV